MRLRHYALMGLFFLAAAGCKKNEDGKAQPGAAPDSAASPDSLPTPQSAADSGSGAEDSADNTLLIFVEGTYDDPIGTDAETSDLSCREQLAQLLPPTEGVEPEKHRSLLSKDTLLPKAGCTEFLAPRKQYALFRNTDSVTATWKVIDPVLDLVVSRDPVVCDADSIVGVHLKVRAPDTAGPQPVLFGSTAISMPTGPIPWVEWEWDLDSMPKFDSTQLPRTVKTVLPGFGILGFQEMWLETRYAWDGGFEESPHQIRELRLLKARTSEGKVSTLHKEESDKGYSFGDADIPFIRITDVEDDGEAELLLQDASGEYKFIIITGGKKTESMPLIKGSSRMLSGC